MPAITSYIQQYKERYFIRNIGFSSLFENFFVFAILAILGIRIFLEFTGYPTLGGGGLHIAHMLWGGGLMLAAIILLLTFLGRSTTRCAAVLAGLGFGTFIDELGKFLTRDNNYFFQPTFALIYVIFVLLYVLFYSFGKYWKFSKKEYLINSLDYMKEAVINDLDSEEKKLAIHCLSLSDKRSPITETIRNLYKQIDAVPLPTPNLFSRIKKYFTGLYFRLISKKWFSKTVTVFFIIDFLASSLLIIASIVLVWAIISSNEITTKELYDNSLDILNLFASTISGLFVIIGVLKMRKSRLDAYKMFKKSLLISILLVQFFSFYKEQLHAFTGLLLNILILTALNYMIEQEETVVQRYSG